MAGNRIKGITIEIGGDTTKLDKALSGTNNQLKDTQAKLKDVERLLKYDPGNVELLEQKQRLLAQSVDATTEKLKMLKHVAETSTVSNVRYEKWEKSFASLQGHITRTSNELVRLEDEGRRLEELGFAPNSESMVEVQRKTDALRQKLGDLNQKVTDTYEALGRPISIDQWDALQREMSETKTDFAEAEKSLADLNDELEKIGGPAGRAADRIEEVGDAAEDATDGLDDIGEATDGLSGSFGFAKEVATGFSYALGKLVLDAVVSAVKWMWNLDEATEEYREAMGRLNTAFEAAGYNSELAKEAYRGFYNILGDTGAAAEASQILSQLVSNEKDVSRWTDIAAGAYGTFGDALPVKSLIEAANETAKTGKVVGALADALNWAGLSADEFNEMLGQSIDAGDRANLIMDTLTHTYRDAADAFYENNESIIATRESQERMSEATSELGEAVANFKTEFNEAFSPASELAIVMATEGLNLLSEKFEAIGKVVAWLVDGIRDVSNALRKLLGVKGQLDENWNIVQKPGGIPAEPWSPQSLYSLRTATAEELPHLAQGTVARPNNPFLAVIGDNDREPEIVSPYSLVKQAAAAAITESGGGAFGSIRVHVDFGGDFAQVVRMMYPQITVEGQRRGPQLVT